MVFIHLFIKKNIVFCFAKEKSKNPIYLIAK